ncbi:hypothetical protein FZEAL_1419 [Fusarium zealandicum]|uniref:Uncharacterized protein n=1 Tax=Fusarium zealandicum TaxID=1053134 RepID=A0A8H4UST7_9HYPO|nr:hypothetical protein FZEAL_1419 [Fusarium zealandicum]
MFVPCGTQESAPLGQTIRQIICGPSRTHRRLLPNPGVQSWILESQLRDSAVGAEEDSTLVKDSCQRGHAGSISPAPKETEGLTGYQSITRPLRGPKHHADITTPWKHKEPDERRQGRQRPQRELTISADLLARMVRQKREVRGILN